VVITGGVTTAKNTELLPILPTTTVTEPLVAPVGTKAAMLVSLQVVIEVARVPLKKTALLPCAVPKPVPLMVTVLPTAPEAGDMPVMLGTPVTVKLTPLLAAPLTVTTTFPVWAPAGIGTTMLVLLQLVGVASVPLKATVLLPCVAPKLVPVMVTAEPAAPEVMDKLLMPGLTAKLMPLLAWPLTVTTTLPEVAPDGTGTTICVLLQLVGVAVVPLKVTVLVP
jgi:hypothetical protein